MGSATGYYLHQVITILGLYAAGFLFVSLLPKKPQFLWCALLAYPAGLSLWGVIGFLLLAIGIPFCVLSILGVAVVLFAVMIFVKWKRKTTESKTAESKTAESKTAETVLVFAAVLALALICCSGVISISITNDSIYYYSVYPQTIVHQGAYITAFDIFLTDVGQTTAIIGTLPYLFGFGETFGIQLMLILNLILVYLVAVYEMYHEHPYRILATTLSGAFLISATPFLVMSRWILANAYFMSFLFILFVLARKDEEEEGFVLLSALFIAMLSMMRMEGGMIAGLLILCISVLPMKSRTLLRYYTLPVAMMQLLYYAVVYIKLSVNPLYSFLDFKNAVIMIGFLAAIALYLLFIRENRTLGKIVGVLTGHFGYILLGLLLLGNLVLGAIKPDLYFGNLKFFGQNIILQNGWGYFGFFVLILLIYLLIANWNKPFQKDIGYSALFTIGFILFTFAVCWARGGSLRLGIGDSGNRVLMQVIPFVCYSLTEAFCESSKKDL